MKPFKSTLWYISKRMLYVYLSNKHCLFVTNEFKIFQKLQIYSHEVCFNYFIHVCIVKIVFHVYWLFWLSVVLTGRHQIIGRTQLLDVALFRALHMRICKICIQCHLLHEKLKPYKKNGQITNNDKHFTVENVWPPYPSTISTCRVTSKLETFFLKIWTIPHLSYSLEILI